MSVPPADDPAAEDGTTHPDTVDAEGVESLALARTPSEAHLFMSLTPCECGSVDFEPQSRMYLADGLLLTRYAGTCRSCGADRVFDFRAPETPHPGPSVGMSFGPGRSELLDPGQWLWLSDKYASSTPQHPSPDPEVARQGASRMAIATDAMTQVLAFFDEDSDRIAPESFISEESLDYFTAAVGEVSSRHLQVIRDSYLRILQNYETSTGKADDSD